MDALSNTATNDTTDGCERPNQDSVLMETLLPPTNPPAVTPDIEPAPLTDLYKQPDTFSNPTPYRSASMFLQEYRFYIESVMPDSPPHQARALFTFLEGTARAWYVSHVLYSGHIDNPSFVYHAFLEEFKGEDRDALHKGYISRRQESSESAEKYCTDMELLLASSNLPLSSQVDAMINGLHSSIKDAVHLSRPQSLRQVRDMARAQEATLRSADNRANAELKAALSDTSKIHDRLSRKMYRLSDHLEDLQRQVRERSRNKGPTKRDSSTDTGDVSISTTTRATEYGPQPYHPTIPPIAPTA